METSRDPHRYMSQQHSDPMAWIAFQDEAEKVQHESAMAALQEQFPEKGNLVRQLYLQKLREFMPEASIRNFVSIFVSREIRGTLLRLQKEIH